MTISADQNNDNYPNISIECPKGDLPCGYLSEIILLRDKVLRLTEQIRTDALTGLYNFRFFSETLALEMERTRRSAQPMALIILDVDHFKPFNDRWGHETGNKALVHIAQLINLAVRKLDVACRFGGEEFVIILPNTDLQQAAQVGERLRDMVASTPFEVNPQETVAITASLGVDISTPHHGDTVDSLLQRVDRWLYQAKHQGRNRVAHPVIDHVPSSAAVTPEEKEALFGERK
jgi:diguanylate cyclase (GGDEF)-like protein